LIKPLAAEIASFNPETVAISIPQGLVVYVDLPQNPFEPVKFFHRVVVNQGGSPPLFRERREGT
jgi:hypothetical protein